MYIDVLHDSSFYAFLLQIDRDLSEAARSAGCRFCGAVLHSACYTRKPRGLPAAVIPGPGFDVCFSFCCSAEGCRRRHRVASVRFLGPKVYLNVMVLLLTTMRQGPTARVARELNSRFGADRRTLARWRQWWQTRFPATEWWRRERARFMPPVEEDHLPQSLIARFADTARERVLTALKFVASLFTPF